MKTQLESLCQDCLRAGPCGVNRCQCGGDLCGCTDCRKTLAKLRRGRLNANDLGLQRHLSHWSPGGGAVVASPHRPFAVCHECCDRIALRYSRAGRLLSPRCRCGGKTCACVKCVTASVLLEAGYELYVDEGRPLCEWRDIIVLVTE